MSVICTDSVVLTQLVGLVLGFLAGLGVGGGSLLILWLTLVVGMTPETARTVNLLFFLPAAAESLLLRFRGNTANLRRVLPGILSGCLAALIFSFLGQSLDTSLLKKLFGFLLILTGLREIFYKPKK